MKIKIGTKIIFSIEMIFVLIIVFVGGTSYFLLQGVVEDQVTRQLESVSTLKETSIEKLITDAVGQIEFLGTQDKTSHKTLVSFLRNKDPESESLAISKFDNLIARTKMFDKVMILNADGEVVHSTIISDEGMILADREYFIQGQEKTYIQSYYYDSSRKSSAMIVSSPIFDDSGVFLGVLAGNLNVSSIGKLLEERSGLGNTGETFLINSSNLVVTDLLKVPDSAMKKSIFLPQITACLGGNSQPFHREDYVGDNVFGYYRWIPILSSCLITKIDSAEALAPINYILQILLLILILGGLLIWFVSYALARLIVKPIGQLRSDVVEITKGNWDIRCNIKTGDELEEIAKTFNEMTKKLKESYRGLEAKVADKTKELARKLEEMEKMNDLMVGREMKMVELKKELMEAKGSKNK